ncbi:2-keto-4-pentenoate hydratase [Streptomyces catenulae]|uniref:Fumarylacetoacetate hydrolase family protein n=1 Tax=Streptomyces catenulae TaxID=66875 RepID=A0ABV2YZM7_9ACTN|nr:fumarylacetoacetate hydrolase family protein [Streptomyces catenulae]
MTANPPLASASTSDIAAAAARLAGAAASGVPCAPVRDLIGRDDLAAAYAVQAELTARRLARGARITGRKIGLTSESVQRQLGVDRPDFGVLFADMAHPDGGTVPAGRVLQPRVEAEIAFVLRADLADGPLDTAQVREAIGHGVAALEICGSRIDGWDISLGDTVADNASSGAYVLGADRRTLDEAEPVDAVMTMSVNGTEVSTGTGAACLGDPVEALRWLARTARELGEPLRAGQVVLSGALGPMYAVSPGDTVTARLTGFSGVTVHFGEGEPS